MVVHQRLLSLMVVLLLLAALCPGADSKRGKGNSSSNRKGLSKQGLKVAGAAAAAGLLGGTGTGVGVGLLGKGRHGSGRSSHRSPGYGQDDGPYYDGQYYHGYFNESRWEVNRGIASSAPAPVSNLLLTVGHVACFLLTAWIGGI